MSPRDDAPDPEEWDDRDEAPEAAVPDLSDDSTVPVADALEQEQDAAPGEVRRDFSPSAEVPEADALDQARELPEDPDDDRQAT